MRRHMVKRSLPFYKNYIRIELLSSYIWKLLGMRNEATPWFRFELFWTFFLGMRNEATPNSVLNCFGDENWSNPWIRPNRHLSRRYCCADSNVLEEFLWEFWSPPPPRYCADSSRNLIYENFWAGGVKQPLNPSRHPSMDEASSEARQTVATDSS